jgi:hypothetical protein
LSDPRSQSHLLALVAAYGIPGALLDGPGEPLDDRRWALLLSGVAEQRVCGMLARAVSDGALPATEAQIIEANNLAAAAAASCLLIERSLLAVADVLLGAGVPFRVLKGAALAHTVYANPGVREFGDTDLLFLPGDLERAVDLLCAAGAHRRNAELRPGFDARFSQGTTLVDAHGIELDLHRTLVDGPHGMALDAHVLFAGTTEFRVGGRRLLGLGSAERLLHACVHAALGSRRPRLVPLRDVAELVLASDAELGALRRLASDTKLEAVVARAVRLAWTTFALADVTGLSRWALSFQPTEAEQRILDMYVGDDPSWGARAVESARRVRGVRGKAAYLRAVAFPDDEALHELGRSRGGWWRRGARIVLRPGHRS